MVKGQLTETTIPTFNVSITSNDASFKYPDLPKAVEHISINTIIKNTTGNADDTYVDINTLDFQIDQDVFKASAHLKNLTGNMLVDTDIDGVLNLAKISQVYPVELDQKLSGILKAKVNTAFDMEAIESNAYERIKSSGSVNLSGFEMTSEDFVKPIQISQANLTFNPGTVSLNTLKAKTGETDLNATGTINNLLGFVFSDQTLKGNFDLNSYLFKVNDFMSESEQDTETSTKTTTPTEAIKIPAFLDCTINAKANMVVYDNLNLEDVTGTLIIKDEQVTLQNVSSSIFNGKLGLSGNVSTKSETTSFNMAIDANNFDIAQSFKDLELLRSLAPIAQIFKGKLNTNIAMAGDLNNDFTPKLNSLTGEALAELLATSINNDENGIISKLDNSVDFMNFEDINLNDLKTKLEFTNGKVSVAPFDLKYKDIDITVTGAHGFDKSIDYSAVFSVPAKYLGSDINRLIGKIDDPKVDNMSIPVTANITGSYTSPSVKTDLTSAAKDLSNQLLEIQKEKLLNQGKDEINNLIGDVIGGNKTKSDSLKQDQSNHVQDVLNGIVGSKENTATDDSTSNKANDSKKVIKNVLDGFLGGKKKE
ncbi:AsmA family protein [Pseudotamlana haliotis]|uniref:AsmA family protein n=1 Tax=Pseudotamlana haliotis TaxID=2614804 RepID=UPI001CD9A3B0|nr:AsmA-like C-terminal region-containing protein [Tamlana haliotis]